MYAQKGTQVRLHMFSRSQSQYFRFLTQTNIAEAGSVAAANIYRNILLGQESCLRRDHLQVFCK